MNFNFKLEPGKKRDILEIEEKKEPIISVIMPYYNSKEYIEQTVTSVLNQTFPYFELLIIDDGSTDKKSITKLKEIEKMDSRIKVFQKKNEGLAATRDYGIKKSNKSAKYIFILDDDDLIDKTYFETAYFALETNKNAAWAYADSVGFANKEYIWKYHFDSEKMKYQNILLSCAMIRKEVLQEVNGYEIKEKSVFEDWNLWLKLIGKGYYPIHLSYYAFWYRRKEVSELKKSKENYKKSMMIIKKTAQNITKKVEAIEFPRDNYNWDGIVTKLDNLVYPVRKKTEKKNILLVIPWMVMGGADKFNLDFIKLLDKNKYNITIITNQPTEYMWRQEFEQNACEIFDLSTFLDRKYWTLFINYIIKTRNIDLFFNTNSLFGYAIMPYIKAENPKLPILDYIHMEEWYNRNGGYSRDSAAVTTLIDKTLFCNQNSEIIFKDYFKVTKNKTNTVYIGVDANKFDSKKYNKEELKEKYEIEKDKINIGYICRIADQKRPFLLIEIIKETVKDNKNIKFLIAGDGPLLGPVKEKIKNEKLQDYVQILGSFKIPQEFYAICDITLNCSIKEGLALTTYESLAMGVPVISSDVGGQKELITEDVGVIIPLMQKETEILNYNYKKEEVMAYKNAIFKIIENIEKYKKNARKKIIDNFTLDKMIKNMEKEIENVIKNPSKEAEENGLKLKDNIRITKEYINHLLLATQWEYSFLCNKYKESIYKGPIKISMREKLENIIFKIEQFTIKIHLYHEFRIIWKFITGLFHVVTTPIKLILLEGKRIINIMKKIIKR